MSTGIATFQPTLPCGERHRHPGAIQSRFGFQPTLPCGERRGRCAHRVPDGTVSTHAPVWGATRRLCQGDILGRVSTHAPVWGATRSCSSWSSPGSRFNPRSRVGSDPLGGRRDQDLVEVSTHAPVWGATGDRDHPRLRQAVSTHAPVWGATRGRAASAGCSGSFNPRSRVGSDTSSGSAWPAPPRFNPRSRVGSDRAGGPSQWLTDGFNPRSRVGSDLARTRLDGGLMLVSTQAPVWGATSCSRSSSTWAKGFNPRSRVGSDPVGEAMDLTRRMFQPTLPCGERQRRLRDRRLQVAVSTHAPVWGATAPYPRPRSPGAGFNPRSRVGSDVRVVARVDVHRRFNPRSRVGSDLQAIGASAGPTVSTHAPVWGATSLVGRVEVFAGFQPTLPCGERRVAAGVEEGRGGVSTHAPVWGATQYPDACRSPLPGFNPRSRVGSD